MLHRQITSPVLVGRRQELEALETLLGCAQAGRGGVALIGGDAGVGKTRLCRALKAEATGRQVRVIEGRSSAAEASVPYGPFMDALRFRLAKGEGEAAAKVLEPVLARVAPLFTSLGDPADVPVPEATGQPFEPIFVVLQRLAALGPVLFILEDIHWADPTSRDLIHYTARRIGGVPLLLVATYRTDEIHPGHPVHRLVAALARERTAVRVHLEPLTGAEVEEMLAAVLRAAPDPAFAEAVWSRTEGNPLFIEELMSVLLQAHPKRAPAFRPEDLRDVAVPATLNEIVWERLSPLSDDTREALTVAAVIGRRFRFDVLAGALQWPEARLLPIVEQLVAHRLLVESQPDQDETYLFRHSLVQEVLYASTIGRRRRLWHRRVAAALEQTGGSVGLAHTTLAHHYSLGGEPSRARVHAVLAGDEAARLCAWRDAESRYEEALAALEREGGDPAAEADILERMAEVAWWQNRISALAQYSSEALAIRRSLGDTPHAAMLLRRLANVDAYQRGELDRAVRALHEAQSLLGEEDSAERVFVLNDLGRLHLRRGEYEEAGRLFERSLVISGRLGDCAEEALSLVMLGWLAVHAGDVSTGVARLELARALLAEQALTVERGAEVFHAGIRALDAAREHRRAREWVEAALEYARSHGARADLAIYRAYQAAVQRRAGEWKNAAALAVEAVAELRASGRAELREALRILGDLQRSRGELDAARASYEEALRLGESDAAIGYALVLVAEHRWTEAAARLRDGLAQQPPADRLFALRVLPILIEADAVAGDLDSAHAALQRLQQLVAGSDYRAGNAALAQARGIMFAATAASSEGIGELRAAVGAWRELNLPYETARASLLLAQLLIGNRHSHAEGITLATEAAERFDELGATLDLSRAYSVLRQGGVRVRRRRRREADVPPPLNRLTARELEVLNEIARGRTNKQIARTLSMSPRTVGNHVSAILAKLQCATRTEASRVALSGH